MKTNTDGWIDPNPTWTYVTTVTYTVPKGSRLQIKRGDRLSVGTDGRLRIVKGGRSHMKAKKGMTKNQKLKSLKTSKAKKLVKATKK